MKKLNLLLTCICFLFTGSVLSAQATPIVIDFDDAITGEWYHDDYVYEEDGFTMSGSFETVNYDNPDNYAYLRYSNFDFMEVSRTDGGNFDFLGVEYLATSYNSVGFISSSNGGLYEFDMDFQLPEELTFSGSQWSNVEWIRFERTGGAFHDLDNILVASVPEPSAIILLGTCIISLVGIGRKQRRN